MIANQDYAYAPKNTTSATTKAQTPDLTHARNLISNEVQTNFSYLNHDRNNHTVSARVSVKQCVTVWGYFMLSTAFNKSNQRFNDERKHL